MPLTENDVIEVTCRYLLENGWKIERRCKTSEQSVDIIATRENSQPLHVEAKGATSASASSARFGLPFNSNQVKSHVSKAFYTAAASLGGNVHSAIALPETELHIKYLEPLYNALPKLGIAVFLVAEDHAVREWRKTIG